MLMNVAVQSGVPRAEVWIHKESWVDMLVVTGEGNSSIRIP